MNDAVTQILIACFNDRMSVTVCGGQAIAYAGLLEEMLALAANQYSIVLLAEEIPFARPHQAISVRHDSNMEGAIFARAAGRQDPDNVVLDTRSGEAYEILLQLKMTGHRLVTHRMMGAFEAHAACLASVPAEIASYADELHRNDLYLQLDGEGRVSEVWQAVPQLVRLGYLDGEGWKQERALAGYSSPQPAAEDAPLELPSEWAPRERPILEELRESLASYRRVAWGPVHGSQGQSKFGGVPAVAPGESWPCCGDCGARMLLVLQLDLPSSPEPVQREVGGEGTLQLFYCISPTCPASTPWEPFQHNSLARVLSGPTVEPQPDDRLVCENFPETRVERWVSLEEGPSWEERQTLCPELREWTGGWSEAIVEMAQDPEKSERMWRLYGNYLDYFGVTPEQVSELASYLGTATGDKLMGWPWWSQAPSYPTCPECSQPMRMVVQVNNDGGGSDQPGHGSTFGQIFAGDGNGHVFHCHGHLTFAWACG